MTVFGCWAWIVWDFLFGHFSVFFVFGFLSLFSASSSFCPTLDTRRSSIHIDDQFGTPKRTREDRGDLKEAHDAFFLFLRTE
jgi:hypothetical protein